MASPYDRSITSVPPATSAISKMFSPEVSPLPRAPLQLSPIRWGKRDKVLARMVCEHMRHANPPIVIPWSPVQAKVRSTLRAHHIAEAKITDLYPLLENPLTGDK